MGGGIMSGLMWGTMTSVIVLGVVSQMAPLPPMAERDVAVLTPAPGERVVAEADPDSAGRPDVSERDLQEAIAAESAPLPLPNGLSGVLPERVVGTAAIDGADVLAEQPNAGADAEATETGEGRAQTDMPQAETESPTPAMAEAQDTPTQTPAPVTGEAQTATEDADPATALSGTAAEANDPLQSLEAERPETVDVAGTVAATQGDATVTTDTVGATEATASTAIGAAPARPEIAMAAALSQTDGAVAPATDAVTSRLAETGATAAQPLAQAERAGDELQAALANSMGATRTAAPAAVPATTTSADSVAETVATRPDQPTTDSLAADTPIETAEAGRAAERLIGTEPGASSPSATEPLAEQVAALAPSQTGPAAPATQDIPTRPSGEVRLGQSAGSSDALVPARLARPLVTVAQQPTRAAPNPVQTAALDARHVAEPTAIAEALPLAATGPLPTDLAPVARGDRGGVLGRVSLASATRAGGTATTPNRPAIAALSQAKADLEVPEAKELLAPDLAATDGSDTETTEALTEETAGLPEAPEQPAEAQQETVEVAQASEPQAPDTAPQVRRDTTGGFGQRVVPLTERDDAAGRPGRIVVGGQATAEPAAPDAAPTPSASTEAAQAPSGPALERNAAAFDNPEAKPKFSVVLIDAGAEGVDPSILHDLDFPVTFAVDPSRPDAGERAAGYRASGFEVALVAAGLPDQAKPQDIEVAFGTWAANVPEALAVIDTQEGDLAGNRAAAAQMARVLAGEGYGFVLYDKGLNSAASSAQAEGARTGLAFRKLDAQNERQTVIGRYLDRAAFKAAQEGSVIVVGHTTQDTVAALLTWALEGRGQTMALAPISAILRED